MTIRSDDGTPLDGVFYTGAAGSDRPEARTVVNFLHGRSMNFAVGLPRFAAAGLVAAGYDVVAMNRRSAGIVAIRDRFEAVGDAWTLWSEHRMDVAAVVEHLRGRGYRRIVMVGHSQGGMLAADYAARNPLVAALILASPARTFKGVSPMLPEAAQEELVRDAQAMVAEGRGRDLLFFSEFPWILSATAAVDPLTPGLVTPLAELAERYVGPLLLLCGGAGHDARLVSVARAAFERSASRVKRLEILEGCDHFYVGFEDRVTALIREWLEANVPPK